MKKLLVYSLAAMLFLPAFGSEAAPVKANAGNSRTELSASNSASSIFGKRKKGKKKKRKDMYRPGARQN
jgi:hypothetical protein